jgi:hypothetical protein
MLTSTILRSFFIGQEWSMKKLYKQGLLIMEIPTRYRSLTVATVILQEKTTTSALQFYIRYGTVPVDSAGMT